MQSHPLYKMHFGQEVRHHHNPSELGTPSIAWSRHHNQNEYSVHALVVFGQ